MNKSEEQIIALLERIATALEQLAECHNQIVSAMGGGTGDGPPGDGG